MNKTKLVHMGRCMQGRVAWGRTSSGDTGNGCSGVLAKRSADAARRPVLREQHLRERAVPGGAKPGVRGIQPGGRRPGHAGALRDERLRQHRLPHARLHVRHGHLRGGRRLPAGAHVSVFQGLGVETRPSCRPPHPPHLHMEAIRHAGALRDERLRQHRLPHARLHVRHGHLHVGRRLPAGAHVSVFQGLGVETRPSCRPPHPPHLHMEAIRHAGALRNERLRQHRLPHVRLHLRHGHLRGRRRLPPGAHISIFQGRVWDAPLMPAPNPTPRCFGAFCHQGSM